MLEKLQALQKPEEKLGLKLRTEHHLLHNDQGKKQVAEGKRRGSSISTCVRMMSQPTSTRAELI
jgi:hypothetical protein